MVRQLRWLSRLVLVLHRRHKRCTRESWLHWMRRGRVWRGRVRWRVRLPRGRRWLARRGASRRWSGRWVRLSGVVMGLVVGVMVVTAATHATADAARAAVG